MDGTPGDGGLHPMGVVVQRTGLTPHVLRAWERRHGAVEPGRTEGGQRLYSDADVARLRLLKRATEAGRPIGTVAGLSTERLAALVGEDGASTAVGEAAGGVVRSVAGAEGHLAAALDAAGAMDQAALRTVLMRAVVKLGAPGFVGGVAVPLLERVGELWEGGELRPMQEHVVSNAVRQVLDWLLSRYAAPSSAPLLLAGTLSGELHEFGAMLAAVVSADAGWRVLYPGPSLPPEELAEAARRAGASVVAVSVVHGEGAEAWSRGVEARAARELAELDALLPEGALLVVGGRRARRAAPASVTVLEDLEALRGFLGTVRPLRAAGAAR